LSLVHEELDELFQLLVDALRLSIGLQVVCRGCRELDPEETVQFAREVCNKLRAAIGDDTKGRAMVLSHVVKEQTSCAFSVDRGVGGREVHTLP
jgi:hypothetical protein